MVWSWCQVLECLCSVYPSISVWFCDFSWITTTITMHCIHVCWGSTWNSNVSTSSCRLVSEKNLLSQTGFVWDWSTNWLQLELTYGSWREFLRSMKVCYWSLLIVKCLHLVSVPLSLMDRQNFWVYSMTWEIFTAVKIHCVLLCV